MKILTHAIHTGYDFEFAKTGHEFFCVDPKGVGWNLKHRPQPENWKMIQRPDPNVRYDLAIFGSWIGYDLMKDVKCPKIFNQLADGSYRTMPSHIERDCSAVTFLSYEVAGRWRLKDPSKKVVILMGVDSKRFSGWEGNLENRSALTVGTLIPQRWEKGFMQLKVLSSLTPIFVVGFGNEGLEGSVGELSEEELLGHYRSHRVYFNPGCVFGISVAEAMMTGMPIVTFPSINLCNLITNGVEGYIVDTVDEAAEKIQILGADSVLAKSIGDAARKRALEKFNLKDFIAQWNLLFYTITGLEISS